MKTNGRIWLGGFELQIDKDSIMQIIDSFPVNLEVCHSGSRIDVRTYDDGRMTSDDKYFYVALIPEAENATCERLQELDKQRYELSFHSSLFLSGKSELIIKDTKQRYQLNIHSCCR